MNAFFRANSAFHRDGRLESGQSFPNSNPSVSLLALGLPHSLYQKACMLQNFPLRHFAAPSSGGWFSWLGPSSPAVCDVAAPATHEVQREGTCQVTATRSYARHDFPKKFSPVTASSSDSDSALSSPLDVGGLQSTLKLDYPEQPQRVLAIDDTAASFGTAQGKFPLHPVHDNPPILHSKGKLHGCRQIIYRNTRTGQPEERVIQILAIHENPEVFLIPELLTDSDCERLLQLCEGRWERSKTSTGYATAEPRDYTSSKSPSRTSWSVPLAIAETDIVENIERIVSAFAGMPVEHLEPLVVVRYEEGQYFKLHSDGGFRPKTILLYLNDVEAGGETSFENLGFRVAPMKGAGVLWNNSYPGTNEIDPRLIHAGLPPEKGVKFVVNCFFNKDPIRNDLRSIAN
ncbi:oxidoreductase, 2OG-Fe(II) oxygenase family protein [Toxoplasma gondii ARI]|uniref:Oxidoreductase, 2OG-Fe(II) oxygenase family protein n=1 Tax=Toxoplasma gondii ARI TaxID=1074872 RepID=A0A139XV87_TOXGO|nr:oxidoreductase, 2OG-Fe(II) oxygenase family protein [Toxoplasma gondii ARI]